MKAPETQTSESEPADVLQVARAFAPNRSALLVIDVQRDFAAVDGLLGRSGADLSAMEPAIDRMSELIAVSRKSGVRIVFLRVETAPESDSEALVSFYQRKRMAGGHAICRAGSAGAEYYRLAPEMGDIEITKPLYDGFYGTGLEALLRQSGVDTVLLCGLSTDCCVDTTARSAFHRNFHVAVVANACATYDAQLHDASLRILEKHCATLLTSAAVLSAWDAAKHTAKHRELTS